MCDFNDARFIVSINETELNMMVAKGHICYLDLNDDSSEDNYDHYSNIIRCYSQKGYFTARDLVHNLIKIGHEQKDSHIFLERFNVSKDSCGTARVTMSWGS